MGEQADRQRRGEWYLDEPALRDARLRCRELLERFNAAPAREDGERRTVLTALLGQVGRDVEVLPHLHCGYGRNVSLGDRVFVNAGATFLDDAPVSIGADTRLGPGVQLLTSIHPVEDHERRRAGWERAAPIDVGANAWLGGGVVVCPGVRIGDDAVVGAGSVVVHDVPARTVVAGNPARVLRTT